MRAAGNAPTVDLCIWPQVAYYILHSSLYAQPNIERRYAWLRSGSRLRSSAIGCCSTVDPKVTRWRIATCGQRYWLRYVKYVNAHPPSRPLVLAKMPKQLYCGGRPFLLLLGYLLFWSVSNTSESLSQRLFSRLNPSHAGDESWVSHCVFREGKLKVMGNAIK